MLVVAETYNPHSTAVPAVQFNTVYLPPCTAVPSMTIGLAADKRHSLAVMDLRATAIHIAICAVIGGLVAAFSPAKWLAASLWVSAAMFINGSVATVEDACPGGFNNPEGTETPEFAKGAGAFKYAPRSLAITLALAGLGFYIQFK